MRLPISWLREFVDVPIDASAEDLLADFVRVGFEEEAVHGFDVTGPLVVGRVLDFTPEPQSNGKTINWCHVEVAPGEVRGIVCGAHNFGVGDKVVVALPGAVLPGPFPIAARSTYGHISDGMIASAKELGLGEDHSGILRLASLGLDPDVGTDASELLGLSDTAVEINVTPDRGYAFSLRGAAREYSHSTGAAFTDPISRLQVVDGSGFTVSIADDAPVRGRVGSSVFVTRVVRNVDPSRPTPPWMVSRLLLSGIRSISLLVDITNYVMWELGQPIHGYDLDALSGGITVRRAKQGESLTTLDGTVRALHPEDLLITDDSGPIGLAGVMGGATTEMSASTTNVLIEAAHFDPTSIARTARRHELPSEASKRFERGVDPAVARFAAARVVELLVELAGGTADPLGSTLDNSASPAEIALPEGFIASLIGVDFSAEETTSALRMIGCSVATSATGLAVQPPSWRPDLIDAPGLAEEVARIVGYDRIPSVLPVAPPGRGLTRSQMLRRTAATALAAAGGTEVLSYPFVSAQANDLFGRVTEGTMPAVRLANPLDASAGFMRTSLLPGLLDIARRNHSRGLTDLAIFELGAVFLRADGDPFGSAALPSGTARPDADTLAALNAGIPEQPRRIAAVFTGDSVRKQPGQPANPAGISDAITTVQQIGAAFGIDLRVEQGSHQALHPGRTAWVYVGALRVGFAGELLPKVSADLDLPRVVAVVELDLDALIAQSTGEVSPQSIATMPAATQDLSLVLPSPIPAGDVLAVVRHAAGELLEHAELIDDYRGSGVPVGSKSLTFALRFRAADRTLTAAEASLARTAAAEAAAARFGAVLRE